MNKLKKTSSRSKPHRNYEVLSYLDVENRFKSINFKSKDYDTAIDIANIISHVKAGSSHENAYTDYDNDLLDKLNEFIEKLDYEILKKSPLEIASNIMSLFNKDEDEDVELTNEDIEDDQEDQEDQENEGGNSESNDSNEDSDSNSEENGESNDSKSGGTEENGENGKNGEITEVQMTEEDGEENEKRTPYSAILKNILKNRKIVEKELKEYYKTENICFNNSIPMDNPLQYKSLTNTQKKFIEKLAILESKGKLKAKVFVPKNNLNRMTDYGQINRMRNKSDLIKPDFNYKLMKKSIIVNRPTPPTKQAMCLMIDNSGSMWEVSKLDWVQAIIHNRCVEAKKKNLDLYLSWFLTYASTPVKVNNLKEGEKFFKKLGFNGGDTEVMKCSEQLMEYFKKKNIQVQVVVINDGQDYVDINWKPSEEFHAIMLSQENYNLKEVVSKSGGLYQVFY